MDVDHIQSQHKRHSKPQRQHQPKQQQQQRKFMYAYDSDHNPICDQCRMKHRTKDCPQATSSDSHSNNKQHHSKNKDNKQQNKGKSVNNTATTDHENMTTENQQTPYIVSTILQQQTTA
ncbi:unnamed protein product [Absidia cylindrospora]